MIDLGDALPLPRPSEELERRLAARRSVPAQSLADPGPTAKQVARILELGARTPDHGKLFPWRFVVMGRGTRRDLAQILTGLATSDKARAVLAKLTAAPVSVLVVSAPVASDKVPEWEQVLSAGAVCMNLEHAANALGYAANWITDWYSYEPEAVALLGLRPGERVAGFIHIGSTDQPPMERPRPDVAAITTTLP